MQKIKIIRTNNNNNNKNNNKNVRCEDKGHPSGSGSIGINTTEIE